MNDVQTSNPASSLEGTSKASWGLLEPVYPSVLQLSSWSKDPDCQVELLLFPRNPHLFSQPAEPGGGHHAYGFPRKVPLPIHYYHSHQQGPSWCCHMKFGSETVHAGISQCTCTHMSAKTCAQDLKVHEATQVHKTHRNTVSTQAASGIPPVPYPTLHTPSL